MATTWVMVPVPEELQDQVQKYLIGLRFNSARTEWDVDLLDTHLRSLGAEHRELLSRVARSVRDERLITDAEMSEVLGLQARELVGLVQEVNENIDDPSLGALVYLRRPQPEDSTSDESVRVLDMHKPPAAVVLAWEEEKRPLPRAPSAGDDGP